MASISKCLFPCLFSFAILCRYELRSACFLPRRIRHQAAAPFVPYLGSSPSSFPLPSEPDALPLKIRPSSREGFPVCIMSLGTFCGVTPEHNPWTIIEHGTLWLQYIVVVIGYHMAGDNQISTTLRSPGSRWMDDFVCLYGRAV